MRSCRRANDLRLYDDHASGWWDPNDRAFASLRQVTEFRLAVLDSWLGDGEDAADVVDLGCGGGLLAVPLAGRGARVIGVDRSAASLDSARRRPHAPASAALSLVRADLRRVPLADACADLVLLADVLEHLTDPVRGIAEAARLLRPGGHLFVSTINRTWRARFQAVTLAETLRLIPPGTHDARLFVRPAELGAMARAVGLRPVEWQGEAVDVARTLLGRAVRLRRGRSLAVGYCAWLRRETAA